jgi:hypothetical protein
MDETTQTEVQEAQRKAREAQRNYDDVRSFPLPSPAMHLFRADRSHTGSLLPLPRQLKRKLEPSSSGSPFGNLSTPNSAAVKKSSNGTRSAKPSTGLPKLGSHAARTASRESAFRLRSLLLFPNHHSPLFKYKKRLTPSPTSFLPLSDRRLRALRRCRPRHRRLSSRIRRRRRAWVRDRSLPLHLSTPPITRQPSAFAFAAVTQEQSLDRRWSRRSALAR